MEQRNKVNNPSELTLVSFVDATTRNALAEALAKVGLSARILEGEAWIANPHSSMKVVLLLGDEPYPRERLLSTLRAPSAPEALGAFTSARAAGDECLFGACVDFLGWPCHPAELAFRVGRLLRGRAPSSDPPIEADVLDECLPLRMLGHSAPLQRAIGVLKKFARCEAPVLIEGETGTGKELAARAIHYLGARRDHPFVAVNCGAIPDNLLENELFGHEKGAYTDARERQTGLVEQAQRGTLFFDEVDALSEKGQVSLLRFLQEQEYRPLGARHARKSDVRIVAATNVDLAALAHRGRFRKDLVFRLQVLAVTLPPLRDRDGDVNLLAEHFLRQYAARYRQGHKALHPETFAWMRTHVWMGNVRELENLLHRHYLLSDGATIRIPPGDADEGATLAASGAAAKGETRFREAKARVVATFERSFLQALLLEAGGNISLAARRAGKDRSALRRLMHKHGVQVDAAPPDQRP